MISYVLVLKASNMASSNSSVCSGIKRNSEMNPGVCTSGSQSPSSAGKRQINTMIFKSNTDKRNYNSYFLILWWSDWFNRQLQIHVAPSVEHLHDQRFRGTGSESQSDSSLFVPSGFKIKSSKYPHKYFSKYLLFTLK